jgi:hypothetical protein
VTETTHNKAEQLFAIEADEVLDLGGNLAAYRRLTESQKAAIAAELRRKVEIEIAIAEERQASRRQHTGFAKKDGALSRVKSALIAFMRIVLANSPYQGGLDRRSGQPQV